MTDKENKINIENKENSSTSKSSQKDRQQVQKCKDVIKKLKQQNASQKESIAKLKSMIKDMQEKMDDQKLSVKKENEEIHKTFKELNDKMVELKSVSTKYKMLQTECNGHQTTINKQDDLIQRLQKDVSEMKIQLRDTEEQQKNILTRLNDQIDTNKDIQMQLDLKITEISCKDKTLNELRSQSTNLYKEMIESWYQRHWECNSLDKELFAEESEYFGSLLSDAEDKIHELKINYAQLLKNYNKMKWNNEELMKSQEQERIQRLNANKEENRLKSNIQQFINSKDQRLKIDMSYASTMDATDSVQFARILRTLEDL